MLCTATRARASASFEPEPAASNPVRHCAISSANLADLESGRWQGAQTEVEPVSMAVVADFIAWLEWQTVQPGRRGVLNNLPCRESANASAVAAWHLAQVWETRWGLAVDSGSLMARVL